MKKQRKFGKLSDVKVGLKVVVNTLPDAVVYTVEEIHGLTVRLSYEAEPGMVLDAGWIDYSVLMTPKE